MCASLNRRLPYVPLLDFLLVVRLSSRWIGKNPIARSLEKTFFFHSKSSSASFSSRGTITRVLGFHFVHSAVYHASLNQQCHVLKIEVAPLESSPEDPNIGPR